MITIWHISGWKPIFSHRRPSPSCVCALTHWFGKKNIFTGEYRVKSSRYNGHYRLLYSLFSLCSRTTHCPFLVAWCSDSWVPCRMLCIRITCLELWANKNIKIIFGTENKNQSNNIVKRNIKSGPALGSYIDSHLTSTPRIEVHNWKRYCIRSGELAFRVPHYIFGSTRTAERDNIRHYSSNVSTPKNELHPNSNDEWVDRVIYRERNVFKTYWVMKQDSQI